MASVLGIGVSVTLCLVQACTTSGTVSSMDAGQSPGDGAAADARGNPSDSSSLDTGTTEGGQGDDAAATACVGCDSRLSLDVSTAPTCTANDVPTSDGGLTSSHALLIAWGECLCQPSTCATTCAICSDNNAAFTQACLNCGQQACASQYAACAADRAGFVDAGAGD